jgi:hemerythrin-like domain-containing protein
MKILHEGPVGARRRQVLETLASAAGLALIGCAGGATPPHVAAAGGDPAASKPEGDEEGEAEVTPGEDLMQEHGVIERILLIYDEAASRAERGTDFDPALVGHAAGVVEKFVEKYHEQNEEAYVFPRLKAAGKEQSLVSTLLDQHQKGRALTADIQKLAQGTDRAGLARSLRSFTRMYRPHAAWEDTVAFPAFRRLLGREGYRELGEKFEEDEHARFGEHGFEDIVSEVATIERGLGIGDLAQFTPA